MRIPAKANTIMTPRMISQKKRSMSILVGHSGLSTRLTRICCDRCVVSMAPDRTKRGGLHQNRQTYSFEHRGSRQSTWVWRRDTRENMSTFQGCFEMSLEGTEVYAYALRSTSSQVGAVRTRFPLLLLPFFPSMPDPAAYLPGPACRLPKPLPRDTHHLQPRQRDEHLAEPSSKDENGAADDLSRAPDGQPRLPISVCKAVASYHRTSSHNSASEEFYIGDNGLNRLDMTWPGHSTLRL